MPVKNHMTKRLQEIFDSKRAFYNVNESDNDDENYNENNEQQQLPEGFGNSCCNIVSPILLQNLINALPSVCTRSTVEKQFYLLKM